MIKARNKKLSLILVLAMVMTMFAGLGTAGAATGYSATHVPLVEANNTTQSLGTLIVEYDLLPVDNNGTKNAFTIKLPADFEVANATPSIIKASGANINVLTPTAAAVVGYDIADNNIIVSVTNASIVEELKFGIDISAYVPSNAPSEITASILANPGSPFPDGRVTIAKTGAGKVDVIPDDPKTFTAATETPIQIKFRENKTNAIEEGNRTLKLKLPQGFEWANTTAALVSTPYSISGTRTDDRTLEFNRTTAGTAPGIWVLTNAAIQVDEDLAEFGDVYLTISGKSDVQPTMIPLGVYADYQAAISAVKPDTNVIAGRDEQQISNIEIKESIKGSLIAGRTVYLELPDGVKWRADEDNKIEANVDSGDFDGNWSFTRLTNNASKAKLTIGGASTKNGAKLVIKDACVDIAVDYNGPITATVSGSAGLTGDVQVAEAVAPITATADAKDVKIGIQNQPGGNIIITETQADAITKGDLVLKTANNVNWAKIPTVKVIEGDLKLDEASVSGDTLTIPVKVSSSKASKIEISDVFYTVDRTVPEGDMEVYITGSALDVVNAKAGDNNPPVFKNRTMAAKVVTAKVVTPAPGNVANVAVFNYGETSYLLNGSPVQMDVAPYAKNNRTYVPVRYCANALGISDNNIIWNQQNKTVTMMKGDKVVQLTLGSNVMTINGVDIYMDVVVEAQNGRTFLPAAWVAQAFGAQAVWDPADPNTVVVSY